MRNHKIVDICMDILTEMYKKATPSANLKKLMASGETKKDGWFGKYYLPMDQQEAIIKKHLSRHKMSSQEQNCIKASICLGASPNSCKENHYELH